MKAVSLLVSSATLLSAAPATTDIKVDQVGYLPTSPKIAIVVSKARASEFVLRNARDRAVAFRGRLSDPAADADSGDHVQVADFSALSKPGEYYIDVDGVGRSWKFRIARDVYSRAYYLAMRSYYGQRCQTEVDLGPEFKGFKHGPCHLDGAYHPTSGKSGRVKPSGGWHDAGDYGRYVVNSGISTGALLWTWELFGDAIKDISLTIPESKNQTPDILDEIRWNLRWMLSMQDEDGGVWHKQTSEVFCPFIMPEKDQLVSYVIGTGKEPFKSSCATADFTAVMAIAGRIYRPFDPSFASQCLRAAQNAWLWLDKHPDVLFSNPPGVSTGAYGDRNCSDERLWAAAELSRSIGDGQYERYFLGHYEAFRNTVQAAGPPSWNSLAPLALWAYVLGKGKNADAVGAIREDSLKAADAIVERSSRNGYRVSLTARDYIWGSNGVAANYGMQLLVANVLRPDERYADAALDNLHYLLGRNTFSLSFVTQLGEHPFRHPHHRPSGSDANAEPWPGLLSGGPNQRRQDPAMRKLPDLPPANMYLDEQESFATNEVAINWNAPLVFLLAGVLAAP